MDAFEAGEYLNLYRLTCAFIFFTNIFLLNGLSPFNRYTWRDGLRKGTRMVVVLIVLGMPVAAARLIEKHPDWLSTGSTHGFDDPTNLNRANMVEAFFAKNL